jgi:hypothetical protein
MNYGVGGQRPLIRDSFDVINTIRKGKKLSAKIVTLCIYFLICFLYHRGAAFTPNYAGYRRGKVHNPETREGKG